MHDAGIHDLSDLSLGFPQTQNTPQQIACDPETTCAPSEAMTVLSCHPFAGAEGGDGSCTRHQGRTRRCDGYVPNQPGDHGDEG